MMRHMVENQLGILMVVPEEADDNLMCDRHMKGYTAVDLAFKEQASTLFSRQDESGDFSYVPFELCECEWDSEKAETGETIRSIWFHGGATPFTSEDAVKLRELTVAVYAEAYGLPVQFHQGELYEKWEESTRRPMAM